MRSDLFAQDHQEQQTTERWVLQSKKMLRVTLGDDVLSAKGAMVAFQGQIQFNHEGSGSLGQVRPPGADQRGHPADAGERARARSSSPGTPPSVFLVHARG